MILEDTENIRLLVPAHHHQQQPAFLELHQITLNELKTAAGAVRTKLNSIEAPFPHYPAPERVIAVDGNDFGRAPPRGENLSHQGDSECLVERGRVGHASEDFALAVARSRDAYLLHDSREIEHLHTRHLLYPGAPRMA